MAINVTKYLIPVSWLLWGALLLVLLCGFVMTLIEDDHTPEVSPGFGVLVVGVLLVVHAGVGLWLIWATRRRSSAAVIILTLLLAYPFAIAIAIPVVRAWETWRFESELARVGDFPDPAARALAERIQSGDIAGLQRQLAGGAPPTVCDRAGNDLLAFAAVIVRDRGGNSETVRILLEAGADPRGILHAGWRRHPSLHGP